MTADAVDGGAARPAPDPRDAARVAALLGREPRGRWDVVVRDAAGPTSQ